jgi:hypothetical protein
MLPDRGYNITGTTDFRARLYKLSIDLRPILLQKSVAGSCDQ